MKLRKFLSLALALMMVLSLVPTAFAADGDAPSRTATTEAYLTKTLNAIVGKAMTFKFTATQDTTQDDGFKDDKATLTIDPITFQATDIGTIHRWSQLKFGTFTASGVYKFTVTEEQKAYDVAGTNELTLGEGEKLLYSNASYTVEAYVEKDADNNFVVKDIVVKNDEGKLSDLDDKDDTSDDNDNKSKEPNGMNFENTYVYEAGRGPIDSGTDPDTETNYDNSGSFKLSKKTVTPTGEDYTDEKTEFTFTVTFGFPNGTDATSLNGIKNGDQTVSLDNNTTTVTLKSGGSAVFTGLPTGTKVTVTEAATPNYKAQSVVNANDGADVTKSEANYETEHTADCTLGVNNNLMTFNNIRLQVPATGVALNILPFVLLAVVAGGFLFLMVFFKRRRDY